MASKAVFSINNLSFSYDQIKVFQDVSLDVAAEKITTIMGANGCGKTTLFNLMTKSLQPEKGTIELENKDIQKIKLKNYAQKVAIVHQNNVAPHDISVEKLVKYGRTPYHKFGQAETKEDEIAVEKALEITKTSNYRNRLLSELSGGQKQRVWIAMALAQQTNILFLDEPTTYVDIRHQIEILKIIKNLNKEHNLTIVMILHDINQAIHYSDEVIVLSPQGNVLAKGEPENVISSELIKETYGIELELFNLKEKKLVLGI